MSTLGLPHVQHHLKSHRIPIPTTHDSHRIKHRGHLPRLFSVPRPFLWLTPDARSQQPSLTPVLCSQPPLVMERGGWQAPWHGTHSPPFSITSQTWEVLGQDQSEASHCFCSLLGPRFPCPKAAGIHLHSSLSMYSHALPTTVVCGSLTGVPPPTHKAGQCYCPMLPMGMQAERDLPKGTQGGSGRVGN